MTESVAERIYSGIPASEGLTLGTIHLLHGQYLSARTSGSCEEEADAFRKALEAAAYDLNDLIANQDDLAAEILEFQVALLEDDDFLAPCIAAISAGTPAHVTWADMLESEIAEYRTGDDEYFRARADDLNDLKSRVLSHLVNGSEVQGQASTLPRNAIVVAEEITPSQFLEISWRPGMGVALREGSRTSHVAILARARGIPLVVGFEGDLGALEEGGRGVLDANDGRLIAYPSQATWNAAEVRSRQIAKRGLQEAEFATKPAVTADGAAIEVMINVDDPAILDEIAPEICDGIGLTRTEFLFQSAKLPNEEEQLAVYQRIVAWAEGRPVTIRTLDAGGDKPVIGLTNDKERNPFLGLRGLRLSLSHPAIFRIQLRALARAAIAGPLKVMVPMVTHPHEFQAARDYLETVLKELETESVAFGRPALGMMVEVPAAALDAESYAADFFSIGSNDLIQYVTASARDLPSVAQLADPLTPGVLRLIEMVVNAGKTKGVSVSVCGDMASDLAYVHELLRCGVRSLSLAPAAVGAVKRGISTFEVKG